MKRFLTNSNGFTLTELLVIIAMIGILLAIAAPDFSKWAVKREINGESQKLYLDLQLARASAVKNNNNVVFTFNTGTPGYTILDDTDNSGAANGGETLKTVPLNNGVSFGYDGSITDMDGNSVTSAVFLSGGGSTVTFLPNGQSDRSGSAYLIHGSDVGQGNGRLRAVSVVQATGAVDYWEYDAGASPPWK